VQKAKNGFFRDQGSLHYFLKITDLDRLLLHPVAGFSFESFVSEEIIRGKRSHDADNQLLKPIEAEFSGCLFNCFLHEG
jgi:hypothetical protein